MRIEDLIGTTLPPGFKIESVEDNDGMNRTFAVGPSGQRIPLQGYNGDDVGDRTYGVAQGYETPDLGGMGAYLPEYFKYMQSGEAVTPQALQQILQTFSATDPQRGGARVFNGATPTTVDELVADPRSAIRMENGQLVYRPESVQGNYDYYVDRISNPLRGFLTDAPGAMMAAVPIGLGALGQMGAIGNVAGTMGSAEFPSFLGDVASQGLGDLVAGAGSSSFNIPLEGSTNALAVPEAGVDFASSFNPTLTAGAPAAAPTVTPLSSLEAMAGTLGSGGSLSVGGLGGLETALGGGLAAGGVSGLGSLTDILQTTGGAAGASGAAGSVANKSALGKLLKDTLGVDVNDSTLDLIGKGLGVGLGVVGANSQANATQDLYNNFMNLGAPYRAELANLNANPQSFYSSPMVQGALQQGSDSMARSLSAKVGNPILNPTALQEMQNYTTRGLLDAYNQRFNQLAGAGQLGVGQSANLGSQSAGSQGGVYNALGAGLQSVFGNQRDYASELIDLMRNQRSSGTSLA